ncbi:MAG TPA: ATP-dependent helicase [Candidatus Pacearchaeota archaeon]|nr:ATP-dependent helicase [Candidatus Pacearchaeota archaeon]
MTIVSEARKYTKKEIEEKLHPLIKEWFFSKFEDFSESQKFGVMNIYNRENILISSPTGSGKTLTAFLSILNQLITLSEKNELEKKVYCIYVSPLKALSNDVRKNLIEPLEEINELAKSKGINLQKILVGLRTGDTTPSEKAKMAKNPPHIMITTPESLAIVLTTKKFVESFQKVEYCIVDEIHSLGNKRGSFLSLNLERLNSFTKIPPTKIGLSATIEPLDEVAKFLVGISEERKVKIAKVQANKRLDLDVLIPISNLIWENKPYVYMYNLIHDLVKEHKTTLIFTNTRSATERVVNYLKDKFPVEYTDENIAAHHSSLSKGHRFAIEENLRQGNLKVVVCSTSLELGIDIGYIDLVILLGSPKASSRALQRVGRAGHKLHDTAKGRFIVMDRDDLIECSIIQKEMYEGKIDYIHFPKNALDVLSQTIFGMTINQPWKLEEMLETIRKSYCYKDLNKDDFLSVISYLSGEYDLEKDRVYAKIWYDEGTKEVGKKGKMARIIYLTNIGTIPEESFVTVKLQTGDKIGAIDESFMNRMHKGDVFVLGGSKYAYLYTKGMNLYVKPAPNKNPTIPSWFSETLPLSFDSALEISKFRKELKNKFEKKIDKEKIKEFIREYTYTSPQVSEEIYEYFNQQFNFSEIPDIQTITIEKYTDERDDKKYVLVNSMYGRRVNDALSRAIAYILGSKETSKRDVEVGISDRGFYISSENTKIEKAFEKLNSGNIEEILKEAIEKTDVLTKKFRHCATRGLMILRTYKGATKSVKKQQMKSHFLINSVKKISKEFPILKEAKREVLEDLMDIERAKLVLDWINTGKVKLSYNHVKIPSPFSLNLILQGHLDLMKIEDKQDFLQRMHKVYMQEIERKQNPEEFSYDEFLQEVGEE